MADKTLKKLKRAELLEMLIEQGKETEKLRERITELTAKLEDRRILLEKAGTVAEASFQMNHVLEAAQAAAQQYLDNLDGVISRQQETCAKAEEACRAECEERLWAARIRCDEMERETRQRCEAMIREAQEMCRAMRRAAEDECEKMRWEAASENDSAEPETGEA